MLLYGRDYQPAFRLIAAHPDGFTDFAFLKAKLDRLLERKGPGRPWRPKAKRGGSSSACASSCASAEGWRLFFPPGH